MHLSFFEVIAIIRENFGHKRLKKDIEEYFRLFNDKRIFLGKNEYFNLFVNDFQISKIILVFSVLSQFFPVICAHNIVVINYNKYDNSSNV